MTTETRVKVYWTSPEQREDEAAAEAEGWRIVDRTYVPNGPVRVTFQYQEVEEAPEEARSHPVRSTTTPVRAIGAALAVTGGILAVVGTALPWVTATTARISVSASGLDAGGEDPILIAAIAAAVALVGLLGAVRPSRAWWVLGLLGGLALIVVGWLDLESARYRVETMRMAAELNREFLLVHVGVGLYAVIGGGIVATVGCLVGLVSGRAFRAK